MYVARRPPIDRRSAPTGVLRHVRRHLHGAQLVDEILRVIPLVGTQCGRPRPVGVRLDHVQRRHALGMSVRMGQTGVDQQAMPVFHQPVSDEAKLGFLALPLLVEPGVRIGGRAMRRVRPLPAMEVGLLIASAALGRSSVPSRGLTLFIDAHASISVPSTEK